MIHRQQHPEFIIFLKNRTWSQGISLKAEYSPSEYFVQGAKYFPLLCMWVDNKNGNEEATQIRNDWILTLIRDSILSVLQLCSVTSPQALSLHHSMQNAGGGLGREMRLQEGNGVKQTKKTQQQ